MALDGDLIKQKQNIGQPNGTTDATTVAPSPAPSPTPTPVPMVTETPMYTSKKPVEVSDEAKVKAEAEAQQTRDARATSHQSQVDEVAKMKAQSATVATSEPTQTTDAEFIEKMTQPETYSKLSVENRNLIDKLKLKNKICLELKAQGKELTEGEIYNYLLEQQKNGQLDDMSEKLLAEYNNLIESDKFKSEEVVSVQKEYSVAQKGAADANRGTGTTESGLTLKDISSAERSEIIKNYGEIVKDQDITPEQKVFLTLKQYYSKHNPEFAKLSNEEQKAFINQKINDELMADKKNLSSKDKILFSRDMCTLIMEADVRDVPLEKLMAMPKDEMTELLKDAKKSNFSVLLSNLEAANNEQAMDVLVAVYLDSTDDNYALLSAKEKNEYIQSKKNELVSTYIENGIIPGDKKMITKVALSVLKGLNEDNYTLADLKSMPSEDKNRILTEALRKNEIYKELNYEQRLFVDQLSYIHLVIKPEFDARHLKFNQENVYNYLLELSKEDGLDDEGRLLLKDYEVIKKEGKFDPDKVPTFADSSFTGKAAGLEIYVYANEQLKNLKPGTEEYDKVVESLVKRANSMNSAFCSSYLLQAITKHAKSCGLSADEIGKLIKQVNITQHMENDSIGTSSGELVSMVSEFGDEELQNGVATTLDVLTRNRSDKFGENVIANINYDPDNRFTNVATRAINETRPKERAYNIFFNAINASQPARQSAITQSSIETATNEQKLYYGSEYAQIKNPYVTQGLAAATYNETDSQVKSQLNSYVSYAIKNNGYSADEVKNINTARETGQTSYERNASSTDSTISSSRTSQSTTTNPVSSSSSSASRTLTASSGSTTASNGSVSAKVSVSPANSNTVSQLKEQLAQIQYEHSIALRDKALDGLQNVIDKIQNDQQVRAQKQAELAAKEAKTDEEISQAIKEAETKSAQEQKKAEEQVAKETLAQIEEQEKLEKKYNISIEKINKLKSAARNGDLTTIYTELGTISAEAQKHFVLYLSRKDTATIIGFIRNRSTDKSLIKELCRLNPGLIKSLDSSLLMSCGIEKAEIIKYSDSRQLATLLADLSKVGNREELRLFYDALGSNADQVIEQANIPGTREWENKMRDNMRTASASMASNVVSSTKFTDGQTRQKIRRQDYPDYREFLA